MAKVLREDSAEQDLLEIGHFIATQSSSVEVALRFLDKIDEKCTIYSHQPLMGDSRPDLGENIRLFPVENYVVIYEPLPDGILVLMVTRGSRNIPQLFRRRSQTHPDSERNG